MGVPAQSFPLCVTGDCAKWPRSQPVLKNLQGDGAHCMGSLEDREKRGLLALGHPKEYILILRSLWSMDLMKPSEGPQPSKCSVLVSASLSRPCFGRGRADFSSGDDCSAHSLCVCCRRGRRCFPSLSGSQLEKRSGCGTRCRGSTSAMPPSFCRGAHGLEAGAAMPLFPGLSLATSLTCRTAHGLSPAGGGRGWLWQGCSIKSGTLPPAPGAGGNAVAPPGTGLSLPVAHGKDGTGRERGIAAPPCCSQGGRGWEIPPLLPLPPF